MTTRWIGRALAAAGCFLWIAGCGDDATPRGSDSGPRAEAGIDLGPTPPDGASPSVRCATHEECAPAMGAAPCALTFCDRVSGRCVTTGPDSDADGHADARCDPGLGPTAVRGDDCDDLDPMRFPGRPEMCDDLGFDEDCDSRTVGGGTPGDGDADGDGFVSSGCTNRDDATGEVLPGPDCDDSNAAIHPRAVDGPPDTCNGTDDNCDGDIDPGCSCASDVPCGPSGVVFGGTSICAMGVQRCVAGTLGTCEGAVYPRAETCEIERLDDDCDGAANEPDVCECNNGETGLCGGAPDGAHNDEPAACRRGTRTCLAGRWQSCEADIGPSPESCDGRIDEDCDGTIDEDCGCTDGATRPCGSDVGECSPGSQSCSAGTWGDCGGGIGAMPEVCDIDRRDENCDGRANEGCACASGETRPCGIETGECIAGTETCTGGIWGACTGGRGPTPEVCDGDDDDCNGTPDDGCGCTNGATRPCGTDVGDCVAGIETCSGGAWGACSGVGPSPEDCDGGDEDCDNMVDEGCTCTLGTVSPCGGGAVNGGASICRVGTRSCTTGGAWGPCGGNVDPQTEVCNALGLDEDCDGTVDEGCAITRLAGGQFHFCALRGNGSVSCWGTNFSGQLGNGASGSGARSAVPIVVPGLTDATDIAAGSHFTCARRSGGAVRCWGGLTGSTPTPTDISGLSNVARIFAGYNTACALLNDGSVRCWGLLHWTFGSTATPTVVAFPSATELAIGSQHICAMTPTGAVWCVGSDVSGQMGNAATSPATYSTPVMVELGALAVAEIDAGERGTCGARRGAFVAQVCWGNNLSGYFGSGSTTDTIYQTPTAASFPDQATQLTIVAAHACGIYTTGSQVKCWGSNTDNALGTGTTAAFSTSAVGVPEIPDATLLQAAHSATCALRATGQVWCWGRNYEGQLGNGTVGGTSAAPVRVMGLP